MEIRSINGSTVTFHHEGHIFTHTLDKCSHPNHINEEMGVDNRVVWTGEMVCDDCGIVARTGFPLYGDGNAQMVHAHYRVATGKHADLQEAMQGVADDVKKAGHVPRVPVAQ